jgi:alanine racemase
MLEAGGDAGRFRAWLKIDTGMHRLGFAPEHAADAAARLTKCRAVKGPLHYMTHLACADQREDAVTARQIDDFAGLLAGVEGERTIANSAGLLSWPDSHADWVRPGIMLYGAAPFAGETGESLGLRPVMTLGSELIAVKTVRAGGRVGYGGTWAAPRDTLIGVAAVGYGDGWPRRLGTGTPVLVGGRTATLVGRTSMDMIAIDLTQAGDARVGDEVVLWGPGAPIEPLAEAAGTIAYELLCGVTQRVSMRVV